MCVHMYTESYYKVDFLLCIGLGKKVRKPQQQKKTYYFGEDMLSHSREGLLTKPSQIVVQLR